MKSLKLFVCITLVACSALRANESDVKNLKRGVALMELHFDQINSNLKEYNERDNDQLRSIIVSLLKLYENVNGSLQRIINTDQKELFDNALDQQFLNNVKDYFRYVGLLQKRYVKGGGFDFDVPAVIERIESMTRPYAQALKEAR